MMNHPELAIISAAVLAYLESEHVSTAAFDEPRFRALITAAVVAYMDSESMASV
jgi:hypothetical protein